MVGVVGRLASSDGTYNPSTNNAHPACNTTARSNSGGSSGSGSGSGNMSRAWGPGGRSGGGNGPGLMVLLGVALLVAVGYIWQGGKADGVGGGARDVQMMRCVGFGWRKCDGQGLNYLPVLCIHAWMDVHLHKP